MRTLTQHQHTARQAAERDPRWAAVLARDPAADTQFVYAVKTTGVYCRPSSPTRVPRPENVEFFDTPAAAEAAGYRPSKRGADQTSVAAQHAELVAAACRRIESAEELPSLEALAADAGSACFIFTACSKPSPG